MSRLLGALLLLSISAFAQSNFATLSGRIEDSSHSPVAGATVTARAGTTGALRTAQSGDNGLYVLPDLDPGPYTVTVRAPGMAAVERNIILEVGEKAALDASLLVGEQHEAVAVHDTEALLKTQDTSLGEVVEPRSVQDLPLDGRLLIDLVLTVPGAHVGMGAQTGTTNPLYWRPGQPSAVTIGGNRPNANYFLIDGVINTDPTFNTMNFSPSPDSVEEFQVQTGSYSAELGGAGGGQINIVSRQGGAQFHGTAYEFLRNSGIDARTWNEMPGTTHLAQNNFGASLGGPLTRHKTFFFANYEGFRQAQAQTMIDTVPTALEDSGNFSQSGLNIFDPFSASPNPNFNPNKPVSPTNSKTIRSPFPNNTIPSTLLSPVATTMLGRYVPRPNMTGGMGLGMTMMGTPQVFGAGLDSNNYQDVRNMLMLNNQGTVRVDQVLPAGGAVFFRYSADNEHGFMPENEPGFGFYHANMAQNAAVVWTQVLSSTAVNTASVAFSRLAMDHFSQNSNVNNIVSQLGIQGVGFGGALGYGAPYFNVQGYTPMGDQWLATPMHMWDTEIEGRDALSWELGSHSIKMGGSYRWYIWPMQALVQSRGYYAFTPGFTTQTSTNDGTGSALASFLLGLPATRQEQAGVPTMDLREWSADAFIQDTWRITPSTTIDFGLRYEFMSPLVDTSRQWSNLYETNGQLQAFIGGEGGMPRGLLFPNKLDFAPRFGLAHHFQDHGLVFRASYGIFYTPVDLNTWCNQLHNVPLVFPVTQQSDNFTPQFQGFNFAPPVLGKTVVAFTAFDPHAPAQYVQQWSGSFEKSLGKSTTLEVGYQGERGFNLQEAVLINNALPGPGGLQPRRPFQKATFAPGTEYAGQPLSSLSFPVSTVNQLQNRARSWYDAGYVNFRRRYSSGLTFLANYTFAKDLSDAPDFRSPMYESAIPQNDYNLNAEKGPACDVRHRVAASAVYDIPTLAGASWVRGLTRNWNVSTIVQVQSGFPFTISVFGDTANAGTILGENPIRANYNGLPVFPAGTQNTNAWFNPQAFSTPAAYTFGNLGRNTVYGPGLATADLALTRSFTLTERTSFSIRAEAFNSLNHSNWGTPNRFVNTPQFGTITEASTPGRELQFSARLSF